MKALAVAALAATTALDTKRPLTITLAIILFTPSWPSASAAADAASVRGQFAFSLTVKPNKTICRRVDGNLLSTLTSPTIQCSQANIESGDPAMDCSNADGSSHYLVIGTLAACEKERKNEAINE